MDLLVGLGKNLTLLFHSWLVFVIISNGICMGVAFLFILASMPND